MRKPRDLRAEARYHVTARVNAQEMLLDSSASKALFLSVVKRAMTKFAFRIENFCVMGNHFHLIILPEDGRDLSKIMQWILSVFAMTYNRICGRTGHVWGERFFSRVIRGLRDFLAVFAYIDDNPVTAGQVLEAGRWRFGGLWHSREGCRDIVPKEPDWLLLAQPLRGPFLLAGPPKR